MKSSEATTNAELKKLLEKALTRFQNWKIQIETNSNPRMVHSLKNIVSIINSISDISNEKIKYSYKALSKQMTMMVNEVAALNMLITDSLEEDDYIDELEEELIIKKLMKVMQAATDLIRIVQKGFGMRKRIEMKIDNSGKTN